MKIVLNENTSLSFNMAAEEYMMKHFDDDIFMLWRAERSVLIGKNQNALAEINYDYVKEHDINVVRRLSGGGTVFCDLGNTNFAFIVTDKKSFSDFRKFTKPILEVLQKLGVNAEFSGRNDLTIEGKKFSGNAQYKYKDRLLHHGTLLFSSDLGDLTNSINPPKIKYESKGISSVKSRVTNIKAHLKNDIDIIKFRELINNHILETVEDAEFYHFSDNDIQEIESIEKKRFNTWTWNYGNSPKYKSTHCNKFKGGVLEVHYEISKGKIQGVKFFGDFFSRHDVSDIENKLINVLHEENAIKKALNQFYLDDFFKDITADEVVSLFF